MFAGSNNREPPIQEHRTWLTGIGHAPPPFKNKRQEKKGPLLSICPLMDPWVQEHPTKNQLNPPACARSTHNTPNVKQNKKNTRSSPKIWDEPDQQSSNAQKNAPLYTALQITALHTPEIVLKRGSHSNRTRAGQANTADCTRTQEQRTNQQQEPADTRSQARRAAARMPAEPGPRTSYQNQKSAMDLLSSLCFLLSSFFNSLHQLRLFFLKVFIHNIYIFTDSSGSL